MDGTPSLRGQIFEECKMNKDIRLSVSFRGHRKRKKLNALLGIDGTGFLIDLWIGAAISRPDGVLSGWDRIDISIESGWESVSNSVQDRSVDRFIDALMSVGFLIQRADGVFVLNDWIEHNRVLPRFYGRFINA
jgi:hypothetical protein